ncbi:hypothetical protein OQA88_13663 [Cercophora sp. LCS_1]
MGVVWSRASAPQGMSTIPAYYQLATSMVAAKAIMTEPVQAAILARVATAQNNPYIATGRNLPYGYDSSSRQRFTTLSTTTAAKAPRYVWGV